MKFNNLFSNKYSLTVSNKKEQFIFVALINLNEPLYLHRTKRQNIVNIYTAVSRRIFFFFLFRISSQEKRQVENTETPTQKEEEKNDLFVRQLNFKILIGMLAIILSYFIIYLSCE